MFFGQPRVVGEKKKRDETLHLFWFEREVKKTAKIGPLSEIIANKEGGPGKVEKKVSPISEIICFSDSLGLWEKKRSETDPSISSGSNGRSKKQPKLAP